MGTFAHKEDTIDMVKWRSKIAVLDPFPEPKSIASK